MTMDCRAEKLSLTVVYIPVAGPPCFSFGLIG